MKSVEYFHWLSCFFFDVLYSTNANTVSTCIGIVFLSYYAGPCGPEYIGLMAYWAGPHYVYVGLVGPTDFSVHQKQTTSVKFNFVPSYSSMNSIFLPLINHVNFSLHSLISSINLFGAKS